MTGRERVRIVNPSIHGDARIEFLGSLDEAKRAMQNELGLEWIPSFTDLLYASRGLIVEVW